MKGLMLLAAVKGGVREWDRQGKVFYTGNGNGAIWLSGDRLGKIGVIE